MRKQIAIISEHASPLAAAGGVDSGGQNLYVAHVARQLARLGNTSDAFAPRDSRNVPQKKADEFPEVREEIERNVAAAADAVIAECPQDLSDLTQHYGLSDKKIVQIPCGFDPEEFEPVDKAFARVLLGFLPHDKIILQ